MAYLTLVVLIAGLLMWRYVGNDIGKEIGRIMFIAACFGICIAAAPATVHLLQR